MEEKERVQEAHGRPEGTITRTGRSCLAESLIDAIEVSGVRPDSLSNKVRRYEWVSEGRHMIPDQRAPKGPSLERDSASAQASLRRETEKVAP